MKMDENIKTFMGQIDLAGKRQKDGKIYAYSNTKEVLALWPETIEVFGETYTLKELVRGREGYESGLYQNKFCVGL